MSDYDLYVSIETVDGLRQIRGKRKKEIVNFLSSLKSNPFLQGDFKKNTAIQTLEVKVFGKYSVYYWSDHAVKEVKVVELLISD